MIEPPLLRSRHRVARPAARRWLCLERPDLSQLVEGRLGDHRHPLERPEVLRPFPAPGRALGSCPAGWMAEVGFRWWRHDAAPTNGGSRVVLGRLASGSVSWNSSTSTDAAGVCAVRRAVPRDGPADEGERRHRWQQVQGGEQSRPELHAREGGTAADAAQGKCCAVSEPARHGRPAGAVRGRFATKTERLKEKLAKRAEQMEKLAAIEKQMLAATDRRRNLAHRSR